MSTQTLLLTPFMEPYRVVPWQESIMLLYLGKIEVVEEYDELVSSPSISFRVPAVARLKKKVGNYKRGIRFSRANVMARDNFTCQYCGVVKGTRDLSYDHVIPQSRGGETTWDNIATSCRKCNTFKRNRTPEEAGMKLLRTPRKPTTLPILNTVLGSVPAKVPELWSPYLEIYLK